MLADLKTQRDAARMMLHRIIALRTDENAALDALLALERRLAVAEAMQPTMWLTVDVDDSWYEEKAYALDDLDYNKVYEVHTARLLDPLFVVRVYDDTKDECIDHEFPTREDAAAFLRTRLTPEGEG